MRRRFLGSVAALLGLGLFGFVLYSAGPLDVLREIGKLGWKGFLVVSADVVAAFVFWTLSWRVLLSAVGIRPRWARLFGSLTSGFAVSYLTPSAYLGGEPVRVMLVGEGKTPLTKITATVVVERILAAISTILFASIGGFFVLMSPNISYFTKKVLLGSLGTLLFFSFFILWAFIRNYCLLSRTFFGLASLFPRVVFFRRAAEKIRAVEETAHRVLSRRPLYAFAAFLFQALAVFCNYMRPQVFFGVGQKSWLAFPQLSLYFSINAVISTFFWITPAGVGVAEGGRVATLGLVGIPSGQAMAFVLTFRFLELVFVGIGVWYLVHRGVGFLGRRAFRPRRPGDDLPPGE